MREWLRQLDELLRGRKTSPELLITDKAELSLRQFVPLAILLGASYGFFMGWFAVSLQAKDCYLQLLASSVKLPALFLLTLVVTFPSLYVFSALMGCGLSFPATLRLLVAAIAVNVAVAASLGPILAFFTLSTSSYSFMIVLNVVLLTIAGAVALGFLLQTLHRLMTWTPPTDESVVWKAPESAAGTTGESPVWRTPAKSVIDNRATSIFRVWVIIYALVGAQMGWLLRPFIGSPKMPFTWFRHREGNFFMSVFEHLTKLTDVH